MKKYAIVTDFDGTLTTKDIAHEICLHHEITSKDQIQTSYDTDDEAKNWMISHFAQVKTTPKEFERFVLKIAKPRKHLKELKHFCKTEKLPFEIVSGGLDIYIKPILKNMGFEDTPFSVRLEGSSEYKLGDVINIKFDIKRSSIFDKKTELRL